MRPSSFSCRGFTLTDVIVATCLVVLGTAVILPAAEKQNEIANRVECAKHLKFIGNGMILYSNENRGLFPRAKAEKDGKVHFFTKPNTALMSDKSAKEVDTFGADGPETNDITAALYLLYLQEDLPPQAYLCPSVSGEVAVYHDGDSKKPFKLGDDPEFAMKKMTNFPSPKYLDYSVVNVYPTNDAISKGYKTFITAFSSDFAVAADLNPGVKELTTLTAKSTKEQLRVGNSPNHGGDGQNVLYADGHVEFQQTCFCGMNGDNIYTFGAVSDKSGGEGIVGSPVGPEDSVLLPSAVEKAEATRAAEKAAKK